MLDSRRLYYFLRITEAGSFSQAASELGVAQPALSHHIAQLEKYLGVTLLVRRPRGVTVTEAGASLLEHARAVVERMDLAERDLRNSSLEISGTVKIGLASSVAASLTPHLLSEMKQRHPSISLHVVEGVSTTLNEWIQSERLDLAVNLEGVAQERAVPFFDEDLYLVGPAGRFDEGGGSSIRFEKAVALPLVMPTQPHSMRTLIERTAAEHGFAVNVAYEVDGFEPLKASVRAGLGYSILSWAATHPDSSSDGKVSASRIVKPSIRRTMVLDASPKGRVSRAALATQDAVSEIVTRLFQANLWRGALRLGTASVSPSLRASGSRSKRSGSRRPSSSTR